MKFLKSITNGVAFVRETIKNYKRDIMTERGGRLKCRCSVSTESTQSMNLTPIAANQTELSFTNGATVLFSYKTPVAAYCPSKGYIRTAKYWSVTTSRHINKWLKDVNNVTEVSQDYLYELGRTSA